MHEIDAVRLNFDENSLEILNYVIGGLLLGVALDLKVEDFRRAIQAPRAPVAGLIGQFLVLPALTFLLTLVLQPPPSVALGMILVAACPGGNLSNYFTWLSKGDAALSVSMTAVSTVASIAMTPLNLALWGSLNPATASLMREIDLDPIGMLSSVGTVIGVPLVTGMAIAGFLPGLADRLRKPFKIGSLLFFFGFVGLLFVRNFDAFTSWVHVAFLPVLLQNALALSGGYGAGVVARLGEAQRRALAIEVGIQNSGLGLLLVFKFFDGLGGMAVITAWWGIWHILTGLSLASVWSRRPTGASEPAPTG